MLTPEEVIDKFEKVRNQRAIKNIRTVKKVAAKLSSGDLNKDTKDLKLKINNWKEKWGTSGSLKYYLEKINNDKDFATIFAKEPGKQNIFEKLQLDFLRETLVGANIAQSVNKLPSSGPNQLFLEDGHLVNKKSSENLKNLDVEVILVNGLSVYGTLKYTGDWVGGHQDNQKHDVMSCLQQHDLNTGVFIFAGVDGPYYHSERGKKNLEEFDYLLNPHLMVGSVATLSEGMSIWAQL